MRKVIPVLVSAALVAACAGPAPEPVATGAPRAVAADPSEEAIGGAERIVVDEGEVTEPGDVVEDANMSERVAEAATFAPLQDTDCFGFPAVLSARFWCSVFHVPADRDAPEARLLGLEVVRIGRIGSQSIGRTDKAPVLFVQGGPGSSALDLVDPMWDVFFEPFSADRDVIVVDQRGTGLSDPFIFCESVIAGFEENFRRFDAEIPQQILDRTAACRDAALRQIALDVFSARESARDLVQLRDALGYEQWHVYGVSHGTRVALEMAALDPSGTASLVLDSVDPIGTSAFAEIPQTLEAALTRVYEDCDADVACAEQYGSGFEELPAVVERLDDRPVFVSQGLGSRVRVDGGIFMSLLHQFLYSAEGARTVPQLVADVAAGDTDRLELVLSLDPVLVGANSQFVLLAHNCIDEDTSAFSRPEDPDLYDLVSTHAVLATHGAAVCDVLGLEHVPSEHELTDTPTLVLAGDYDPITSPDLAEQFAAGLPVGRYVRVPFAGHAPAMEGGCPLELVNAFFAQTSAPLDLGCLEEIEPPEFTIDESGDQGVADFAVSDGVATVTGAGPTDWLEEQVGFQILWTRNRNALDSAVLSISVEPVFNESLTLAQEIQFVFPDADVTDNGEVEIAGRIWTEVVSTGPGIQGTFRRWSNGETQVLLFVLGLEADLAELVALFDEITESIEIDLGG